MVLSKFPLPPSCTVGILIIPTSTWNCTLFGFSLTLSSMRVSISSLLCIMIRSKSVSFSQLWDYIDAIFLWMRFLLGQLKKLYGNRYNDYWKSCLVPARCALDLPTISRVIRDTNSKQLCLLKFLLEISIFPHCLQGTCVATEVEFGFIWWIYCIYCLWSNSGKFQEWKKKLVMKKQKREVTKN